MRRWSLLLGLLTACGQSGLDLSVRADAVEPPQPVEVTVTLDGVAQQHPAVEPGTVLRLGTVPPHTHVLAEVTNTRGAGTVRANILTDNCFRATASCSGPGCVARAEYEVAAEGCVNP